MRFRLMDLIVFPTQTLPSQTLALLYSASTLLDDPRRYACAHLCDSEASPLFFPQQFERSSLTVKILLWDSFQHCFWQLDVSVFVGIVRVSVTN